MKVKHLSLFAVGVALMFYACTSVDTAVSPTEDPQTSTANAKLAVGNEMYELVLPGSFATPVPAGQTSLLHTVDVCTGVTTSSEVIKIGAVTVTSMTGISKFNGVVGTIWGTTGKNSNFPYRLIKVSTPTAVSASLGPNTVMAGKKVALQDIENRPGTNNYYAIIEATDTIVNVNIGTGICSFYAKAPTCNKILNGLTFQGAGANARLWVISGKCNTVCNPKFGDMWSYNGLAIGVLASTNSYKAVNSNLTNPELGLHFVDTCNKLWIVGSAAGVAGNLSTSNALAACASSATSYNTVKPTYDFAPK